MPHVGVVMERSLHDQSLRDAVVNLLGRSIVAAIGKRDIADLPNQIESAGTAFSSWDNCMKADFCKYPAFALIGIGGLILLSVVWCIVRCACCGLSCCCSCFRCLKCCGECCGMCDPPGGRRAKYLDEPLVPQNHDQAYRSQAPMHSGFEPPKPTVPQYAVFESGDKKDGDALPAMPSWDGADSKKVLVEEEEVEMKPLKQLEPSPAQSHIPSPSPISPGNISPYGPPKGATGPDGYMAANQPAQDSFGAGQGHGDYHGYGNQYNDQGQMGQYPQTSLNDMHQGYDAAGIAAVDPRSRQSPYQQDYHDGYGHQNQAPPQNPQSRSPRPYNDEYGRSGTPTSYGNNGYGRPPPVNDGYGNARRSPAPATNPYGNNRNFPGPGNDGYDGARRSPAPRGDGYGSARSSPAPQAGYGGYGTPSRMGTPGAQAGYYGNTPRRSPAPQAAYGGQPQRSRTQDDYTQQQHPPAPRRQYTGDSSRSYARPAPQSQPYQAPVPQSPIQNNSGFDFNSGYSRPEGHQSPAPRQQQQTHNGGAAYPGYRSYKPAQNTQQQQTWDGTF